jgi:hypothetical protein
MHGTRKTQRTHTNRATIKALHVKNQTLQDITEQNTKALRKEDAPQVTCGATPINKLCDIFTVSVQE